MQKYGKIRKLPRLPTKKSQKKIYATPFCQVDYADFNRRTHFSHYPSGTRFCPFLSPLMEFEGVSCYHHSLRLLKCSTIGSCSPSIFRFPRSFLKKRRSFSKKRGSFFSAPSEKRFLTANRNTKKAGNKGPTSLEVQPLMARTDHFQAWTHNYNITRARRKFTQQRRR